MQPLTIFDWPSKNFRKPFKLSTSSLNRPKMFFVRYDNQQTRKDQRGRNHPMSNFLQFTVRSGEQKIETRRCSVFGKTCKALKKPTICHSTKKSKNPVEIGSKNRKSGCSSSQSSFYLDLLIPSMKVHFKMVELRQFNYISELLRWRQIANLQWHWLPRELLANLRNEVGRNVIRNWNLWLPEDALSQCFLLWSILLKLFWLVLKTQLSRCKRILFLGPRFFFENLWKSANWCFHRAETDKLDVIKCGSASTKLSKGVKVLFFPAWKMSLQLGQNVDQTIFEILSWELPALLKPFVLKSVLQLPVWRKRQT